MPRTKGKTTVERLATIETQIDTVTKDITEIKEVHKTLFRKLDCVMQKLTNRLPHWATVLIGALMSLVTGLIMYVVTKT